MIDLTRTTDALPMIVQPAPQTEDDQPAYTPSLLLDVAGLDQQIVNHPLFAGACGDGFCMYFDLMCLDGDGFCMYFDLMCLDEDMKWKGFSFEYYSLDEVLDSVHNGLLRFFQPAEKFSFVDEVGTLLGWLSALNLYQPEEASKGLVVLLSLVRSISTTFEVLNVQ